MTPARGTIRVIYPSFKWDSIEDDSLEGRPFDLKLKVKVDSPTPFTKMIKIRQFICNKRTKSLQVVDESNEDKCVIKKVTFMSYIY